jgi:membrane protease subunit (stomatin/prohibitin family)
MGLFDWIGGQFIDVIEWLDDSHDTMVYRFPRHGNEIKYGAKLTVRESQVAVFVNEGVIADILEPGIYELETKNLPILTSLQHWDHGFNSPFKAEVYFFNTKRFTNLKWGTKNPIMVRDPEFKMVRLRAFGTYEIRIIDPKVFMSEIVGTDGNFMIDEIDEQLKNLILSKFTRVLGESKIPILDLASNYENFSEYVTKHIAPYFKEYGLELTKVIIENISLPENVERVLDRRTSREVTGDLDDNLKYQAGEALGNAKGGSAIGDIMGMGIGFSMGQEIFGNRTKKEERDTPPPLPTRDETMYHIAVDNLSEGPYDIRTIQSFIDKGKIDRDSLVWTKGMRNWEKAGDRLSDLFENTPPPLPPQ